MCLVWKCCCFWPQEVMCLKKMKQWLFKVYIILLSKVKILLKWHWSNSDDMIKTLSYSVPVPSASFSLIAPLHCLYFIFYIYANALIYLIHRLRTRMHIMHRFTSSSSHHHCNCRRVFTAQGPHATDSWRRKWSFAQFPVPWKTGFNFDNENSVMVMLMVIYVAAFLSKVIKRRTSITPKMYNYNNKNHSVI